MEARCHKLSPELQQPLLPCHGAPTSAKPLKLSIGRDGDGHSAWLGLGLGLGLGLANPNPNPNSNPNPARNPNQAGSNRWSVVARRSVSCAHSGGGGAPRFQPSPRRTPGLGLGLGLGSGLG